MSISKKICRPSQIIRLSRRYKQFDAGDGPIDEQFHFLPMGKSDANLQTRVSFLSKDMSNENLVGIKTISTDGFRLMDGQFMFGPIAVFPKVVLSWRVPTVDAITEEAMSLFLLLQPKLDLLVLGVGDRVNVDKVRKRVAPALAKHHIPHEILSTEFAISTFNYMNNDGRYVAAALFPPDDLILNTYQYGKALNMVRDYFEGQFNPLLMGIDMTGNRLIDAINRLYENEPREERETAVKRAIELSKENRESRQRYLDERRERLLPAQLEEEIKVKERWKAHMAAKASEQEKKNEDK